MKNLLSIMAEAYKIHNGKVKPPMTWILPQGDSAYGYIRMAETDVYPECQVGTIKESSLKNYSYKFDIPGARLSKDFLTSQFAPESDAGDIQSFLLIAWIKLQLYRQNGFNEMNDTRDYTNLYTTEFSEQLFEYTHDLQTGLRWADVKFYNSYFREKLGDKYDVKKFKEVCHITLRALSSMLGEAFNVAAIENINANKNHIADNTIATLVTWEKTAEEKVSVEASLVNGSVMVVARTPTRIVNRILGSTLGRLSVYGEYTLDSNLFSRRGIKFKGKLTNAAKQNMITEVTKLLSEDIIDKAKANIRRTSDERKEAIKKTFKEALGYSNLSTETQRRAAIDQPDPQTGQAVVALRLDPTDPADRVLLDTLADYLADREAARSEPA